MTLQELSGVLAGLAPKARAGVRTDQNGGETRQFVSLRKQKSDKARP